MSFELKEETRTEIALTERGYLVITQNSRMVRLSANQVKKLLSWLEDGKGLRVEQDWNNGMEGVED